MPGFVSLRLGYAGASGFVVFVFGFTTIPA